VLAQLLRVEVIAVQVGDEQIVRLSERVPIQLRVVREREPGAEVGRVHPRVGQDGAVRGLDQHAGVAEASDTHPLTVAAGRGAKMREDPPITGVRTWPCNLTASSPT